MLVHERILLLVQLLLVTLLLGIGHGERDHKLRLAMFKTADKKGAGMDGGLLGVQLFGGGEFSLLLCHSSHCCSTGELNSQDDNWERGEINYFVGKQLGQCENFTLNGTLTGILKHSGTDGGLLDYVILAGSTSEQFELFCPVRAKLDHSQSLRLECQIRDFTERSSQSCNGDPGFCQLRVNEFLFPGVHNAGTGHKSPQLSCHSKNNDLLVTELLDLGLRFFDFDVIYSHSLVGCDGLEIGHGAYPEYFIYQCFAEVRVVLESIRNWMDSHKREVIVLYFGEIHYPEDSFPRLKSLLDEIFTSPSVTMNKVFKTTGIWPTLEEAIETNARIITFVRSDLVKQEDSGIIREVSIKLGKDNSYQQSSGEVKILSTFKAGYVNDECQIVVDNARNSCENVDAELIKVSVFGSPFRSGAMRTDCLWTTARKCNRRIPDAIAACQELGKRVNFVQVDYPNYPANGAFSIVDLTHQLNKARVN